MKRRRGRARIERFLERPARYLRDLRRAGERQIFLIEQMPDGVFVHRNGCIVYVNPAMATMLRYDDRAPLLGQMIDNLVHPDDLPTVMQRIRAVRESGLASPPKEVRMQCGDGSYLGVEAVGIQVEFEGQPGIVVILRDLTERKRAERELRQSQERFELALRGADLASWDWNIKSGEVIFNPRWAEMRGYRPEEVKPHVDSWLSGLHPDDRPVVDEALKRHFQGHSSVYATEHRVRSKTGEWLWILDRGRVFARDEAGQPARMVGTELDISEQKRSERERQLLADAGAVLGATLDYEQTLTVLAELVVRDFADWCIVDVVSEQAQLRRLRVTGRDPTKANAALMLEQFPLDRTRFHLMSPAVETRRPLLIERLGEHDLERFAQSPEHLRALRALDARSLMILPLLMRGRLLGTLAFASSTPSRMYSQKDLALARALADRAAVAIDNARLYREAIEATRLRDQVLGVVAHDLRTPLVTILLQAEAMKRPAAEPERRAQSASERIERAAARMNRLIQDLLDVAQLEGGRLTPKREALSAADLLSEAIEMQRPLALASSIDLRLDVAHDLPRVLGDRDRLLQVLENLIGNALKFTPVGGRVTVTAAAKGDEIVFSVADNGIGIAVDDQAKVFDRFWQATRSDRRGAGLGLPICKGIDDAHGGRIWVESTRGTGTTFYFTIPSATISKVAP